MIKCIGTKRDAKGRVLGYYLIDKNKFKKYIEKNKLKVLIREGKLQVANLTLTSDNRLVFKDIKGKTVNVNQRKETTPKKSLKEIVLACGDKGYEYEGLVYFIQDGKVAVKALNIEIKEANILKGTEIIAECAFRCCEDLNSVVIPNSVTSIDYDAFTGCSRLSSITLPESVTSIGNSAFLSCSNLRNIIIPDSIISIGGYAFAGCNSLTSITIPKGITCINRFTFAGCTSLTSITIPKGVTSIGKLAFQGCKSLTSITIPDSVLDIWDKAFCGCIQLTEITIPERVTYIGKSVFTECKLETVKIPERFKARAKFIFEREDINFIFY